MTSSFPIWNSLTCMTGSGKTMIATALALRNKREEEKRTVFFVSTQMLVAQQASAVIANAPELRVAQFHGELSWPTFGMRRGREVGGRDGRESIEGEGEAGGGEELIINLYV